MEMDKSALLGRMEKLALSYTPEWRFDEEHPDVASALALIWADMFAGTLSRYGRLSMKNKLAFFNAIGTRLRPSVPAEGYVTFGMSSGEFGDVEVPRGFPLLADNGEVSFETQEDVFVTDVSLEEIYLTDGRGDTIQRIYEKPEGGQKENSSFYLFRSDRENLQEHMFCLGHPEVLRLKAPARVVLRIQVPGAAGGNAPGLAFLAGECAAFEYYGEEGFVPFGKRYVREDELVLELTAGQPAFAPVSRGEGQAYMIRCRLLQPYAEEDFVIENIRIASEAENLLPDAVQTGNGQEELKDILVFGEQPAPFDEVYIACDQALSKGGARIKLDFELDYAKVPLEAPPPRVREWKLVMKKSDFVPEPEFDITIEQVTWEYYNGSGWSRLFPDGTYDRIFNGGNGTMGQKFSVEFICPADAEPFLLGSVQSRYLRIRILKMKNLFKQRGNYIAPLMNGIRFSFSYGEKGKVPQFLEAANNRERNVFPVGELASGKVRWALFQGIGERRKSLYFRFSGPFTGGPVKILFTLEDTVTEEQPRLEFEYFSGRGFAPLLPVDGTGRFGKSGILTFMGKDDFKAARFWDREGYWIRITDMDDAYREGPEETGSPMVDGIFMNAVRVRAVRSMPEERFRVEPGEKNKVCKLLHPNVQNLEVWVDESTRLSSAQMGAVAAGEAVKEDRDADGKLTRFWVRWTEAEDFFFSGPEDRHYVVDRNQGTVTFSDGSMGAMPPSADWETILIRYACGGGQDGNQPAGSINQMTKTLGFINQVTNPRIVSGGSDQETLQEAVLRAAKRLRHLERAVTASDYEALAMEASRSVLKVKCFNSCAPTGERKPGSIALVVLQKNFKDGGLYFDRVRQEVIEYIQPRLPGNLGSIGRFHVVEPTFLKLRCRIDILVRSFHDVFEVRGKVLARMEEFLDPISGNFNRKGWDIGVIPNEIQIANAIKGIQGILFIREVRMSVFARGKQGWMEVGRDFIQNSPFGVALNGEHQILITVDGQ